LKNKLLAESLRFRGNELVTVRISAFCDTILSNNSAVKIDNFFGISGIFFLFYLINTPSMERINKAKLLSEILFEVRERKISDKIHFSLGVLFLEYIFVFR
jgi:hypothetical protein